MAKSISSTNIAYQLRRGQPDLITVLDAKEKIALDKDTLNSTYQVDYKTLNPSPPRDGRGKRAQLMERFLFEKVSADLAAYEFRPRSPPNYLSTTKDHFDVPGFDPDAGLLPKFQYALYTDPAVSFWSENKRRAPGVTVPDNPMGYFHSSSRFTKPVQERWDNDPEL